jgi:hypothetical protein
MKNYEITVLADVEVPHGTAQLDEDVGVGCRAGSETVYIAFELSTLIFVKTLLL